MCRFCKNGVEEDCEFWNKVMTNIAMEGLVYEINTKSVTSKIPLYLQN